MTADQRRTVRAARDRVARERVSEGYGNKWLDAADGDGWLALAMAANLTQKRRPPRGRCVWCGTLIDPRSRECREHKGLERTLDNEEQRLMAQALA